MNLSGKVLSVETRNLSEPVMAAASIGATSLVVADASTFDENGGTILVNGTQLAFTAIDVDTDTLTLAAALVTAVADQDIAEVYPAAPIKTATVDLGEDGDPIPATVLHSLLDKLPDGIRVAGAEESVTIEQRGTYEFVVADLVGETLTQQSLDYVEGEQGYGFDQVVAQMQDAQVTGELGAAVVSADQVLIGGVDLADTLAPIPKSTKYAMRGADGVANKDAGPTSGTTEIRVFTFDYGDVVAGRLYEVGCRGFAVGSVSGDSFYVRIRPTFDGSAPTTTTPTVQGSRQKTDVVNLRAQINMATFIAPATDGFLRYAITLQRMTGTGTLSIGMGTADLAFQTWCTDLGVGADSTTALQQTAYSDGSGSDNPPEITKVLSLQATHVENFSGYSFVSGSASFVDNGVAYIGWDTAFNGGPPDPGNKPNFAVLHFNYGSIVSALGSASSITSVQLKFKAKTRHAGGLDMAVFAHKYTSFPWSMAFDYSGEISAGRIITGQGSKNDVAPGGFVTIPLLTAVGTNFKSGLYKGLGFYTNSSTDAGLGEIFASPSADRPTLIITYKAPA